MKDKFIQANRMIKEAERILLVTHNRPDGDALSSICALIDYLETSNKKYTAWCLDKPPFQFNFIPNIFKVTGGEPITNFKTYDLIIALDCGSLSRTNLGEEISKRSKDQKVIEFDHHPKVDDYSDLEIRLPEKSSTAEVLYNFFKINKIKITKNIANCILTGIITDTGNFLYPSTSNETIKIGSQMLLYGARFPIILENTWRNKSLGAMKIWGQAMSNLKINKKYNFAFSVITCDDISGEEVNEEELEGLSGFLSNLYGVNGLLWLKENCDGTIKGSLRTAHPSMDMSKLAQVLGGGGHPKASGFTIKGRIEKAGNSWKVI